MDEAKVRERWAAACANFPWEDAVRIYRTRGWRLAPNPAGSNKTVLPDMKLLQEVATRLFESCLRSILEAPNKTKGRAAWSSGRFIVRVVDEEPALTCEAFDTRDIRRRFLRYEK